MNMTEHKQIFAKGLKAEIELFVIFHISHDDEKQ
jgi:hypothetical protein